MTVELGQKWFHFYGFGGIPEGFWYWEEAEKEETRRRIGKGEIKVIR